MSEVGKIAPSLIQIKDQIFANDLIFAQQNISLKGKIQIKIKISDQDHIMYIGTHSVWKSLDSAPCPDPTHYAHILKKQDILWPIAICSPLLFHNMMWQLQSWAEYIFQQPRIQLRSQLNGIKMNFFKCDIQIKIAIKRSDHLVRSTS